MSVLSSISKTSLPLALALSTAVSAVQAQNSPGHTAAAPDTEAYARCVSGQLDAQVSKHIGQYIADLKAEVDADPYFKLQAEAAAQDRGLSAIGKMMVEEILATYPRNDADWGGITRVFAECVKQQLGADAHADIKREEGDAFITGLNKEVFESAMEAYSAKVAKDVFTGALLSLPEGPQNP